MKQQINSIIRPNYLIKVLPEKNYSYSRVPGIIKEIELLRRIVKWIELTENLR